MVALKLAYNTFCGVRGYFRYFSSLKYQGNQYECPFCGGQFSALLPHGLDIPVFTEKKVVGGGYRLNAKCPRCYSKDRERLIYLYLKKYHSHLFSEQIKLLHFAPERNLAQYLKSCSNIEYLSADLFSLLADVKMDITDIKSPDNTYDVIICNHVLEHIPDDQRAMGELFRVLKPGGLAILQVPLAYALEETFEDLSIKDPQQREALFGKDDHVRLYGQDYYQKLATVGFQVAEFDFAANGDADDITRYALNPEEKICVCSKE
jgi:SAM-dependent methyltransferase